MLCSTDAIEQASSQNETYLQEILEPFRFYPIKQSQEPLWRRPLGSSKLGSIILSEICLLLRSLFIAVADVPLQEQRLMLVKYLETG